MTTELTTAPSHAPQSPTSIERVEEYVRSRVGNPVRAEEIQEVLSDVPLGTINASLQHLRNRREVTSIVRVGPATFAYRPDSLTDDNGDSPPRKRDASYKAIVGDLIREARRPIGISELADDLKSRGVSLTSKQLNQAAASARKADPGIEKLSPGVYVYNGNASGGENSGISDSIPDSAFETSGLRVVARAQDGARICVDENEVAWRVTVKIDTRLL